MGSLLVEECPLLIPYLALAAGKTSHGDQTVCRLERVGPESDRAHAFVAVLMAIDIEDPRTPQRFRENRDVLGNEGRPSPPPLATHRPLNPTSPGSPLKEGKS